MASRRAPRTAGPISEMAIVRTSTFKLSVYVRTMAMAGRGRLDMAAPEIHPRRAVEPQAAMPDQEGDSRCRQPSG
jgi:hypothetical protein